jgi:hypothetical protein
VVTRTDYPQGGLWFRQPRDPSLVLRVLRTANTNTSQDTDNSQTQYRSPVTISLDAPFAPKGRSHLTPPSDSPSDWSLGSPVRSRTT